MDLILAIQEAYVGREDEDDSDDEDEDKVDMIERWKI